VQCPAACYTPQASAEPVSISWQAKPLIDHGTSGSFHAIVLDGSWCMPAMQEHAGMDLY